MRDSFANRAAIGDGVVYHYWASILSHSSVSNMLNSCAFCSITTVVAFIVLQPQTVRVALAECDFPVSQKHLFQTSKWLSHSSSCSNNPGYYTSSNDPSYIETMLRYKRDDANVVMGPGLPFADACLCRVRDEIWEYDANGNKQFTKAFNEVFQDVDISQGCLDEMYKIATEYKASEDEGYRMILPATVPGSITQGRFEYAYRFNSSSETEPDIWEERTDMSLRTMVKGMDWKCSHNGGGLNTSASAFILPDGYKDVTEYAEKEFKQNMPTAKFRQLFISAGDRPTGHVPKGCMKGFITGSGILNDILQDTLQGMWNGKCFFEKDNVIYNRVESYGPSVLMVKGQWQDRDAYSWLDGKPTLRIRYPYSKYWDNMVTMYTKGDLLIDYVRFVDEVREHPWIPGVFLGMMWLAPKTEFEDPEQLFFNNILRFGSWFDDMLQGQAGVGGNVGLNTPARGDGEGIPGLYAEPIATFVLFQNEDGLDEFCMQNCD